VRRFIDDLLGPDEYPAAGTLRDSFAPYRATCDLVSLGADMRGSDPRVDRALFARVHQHASRESLSPLQQLFTAVTARKG